MNTPHPDLETLAELADRDVEPASETAEPAQASAPQSADLHTAELLAHVAGCAACTADLQALRRVRDTLRALPPVPMPPEVAERIEAALLAASASSTPLAASGVADTVVPLRQRSMPGRSAPTSSRWRTLPYGAAASIVVLVAVIVGGIVALGHSGSNDKKSASAPAIAAPAATTSGGPATIASGTDYTSADLRSQVAAVVTSNVPGAASNFPGLAFGLSQAAGSAAAPAAAASAPAAASSAPAAAPVLPAASSAAAAPATPSAGGATNGGTADRAAITAPAGPLADPAALARCIQILAGKAEQPLLVDYALFNGAPSTIIVLPDPDVAHKLDIYVEADTANCADQEFTFETFLGPTPGP
ncbi:MAG TPA: hypothetical protein VNE21_08675 [Mycobacteriales bacterium]|nr:hypothetical protein [Mycobacteriales bacterium]